MSSMLSQVSVLETLLTTTSVSGTENDFQQLLLEYVKPFVDIAYIDKKQNLICVKNPYHKRKIMVSAHSDEIGLFVSEIREDGMLCAHSVGFVYLKQYVGHYVNIISNSHVYNGVVVNSYDLQKAANITEEDIIIDIGSSSKEETELYIKKGASVVLNNVYSKLENNCITARALDNKVGVWILLQTIAQHFEKGDCNSRTSYYYVFNTCEETDFSGIRYALEIIKPQQCIVVDSDHSTDYSGSSQEKFGKTMLNGGPILHLGKNFDEAINKRISEIASKMKIPLQYVNRDKITNSDIDEIIDYNQNIRCSFISYPIRYMHSPNEVVCTNDIFACVSLLVSYLRD